MTWEEMIEELKQDPDCRETIEEAETIADTLYESLKRGLEQAINGETRETTITV